MIFNPTQFTYFIYYSYQDRFKNSRIIKIHQVHRKIHRKQFLLFCLTCFVFVIHLNLKRLRFTEEVNDLVMCQRESHENMNEFFMTSCHVMPHPIISRLKI